MTCCTYRPPTVLPTHRYYVILLRRTSVHELDAILVIDDGVHEQTSTVCNQHAAGRYRHI